MHIIYSTVCIYIYKKYVFAFYLLVSIIHGTHILCTYILYIHVYQYNIHVSRAGSSTDLYIIYEEVKILNGDKLTFLTNHPVVHIPSDIKFHNLCTKVHVICLNFTHISPLSARLRVRTIPGLETVPAGSTM